MLLGVAILCSAALCAAASVARAGPVTVPAGTEIVIELTEAVASNTHKRDDKFAFRVASPVVIGNVTAIPAGPGLLWHATP